MTMLSAPRFVTRPLNATPQAPADEPATAKPLDTASPLKLEPAAMAAPRKRRSQTQAPPREPQAQPAPLAQDGDGTMLFNNFSDGFGDEKFETARGPTKDSDAIEASLDAIRREGLTGRQLRTARRLAQRHNLPATSDFDAVRLLREGGFDPFQRASMLDLTKDDSAATVPIPGDTVQLPQSARTAQLPSLNQQIEVNHAAEVMKVQRDIANRRRKRLVLMMTRLFIFVGLPTLLAAWYYNNAATPLYATHSQFQIQMQEPPGISSGGLLAGTAAATQPDSMAVQGYLQSRDAMLRLDADVGFSNYFKSEEIDPLIRLDEHPSQEAVYKLYRRLTRFAYDPTEGVIKMEVAAPDPLTSQLWSETLVNYAEEQIDNLTTRLREDAMADSLTSYKEAEDGVLQSQMRVVDLQEQFKMMSAEAETTLVFGQLSTLEAQISADRIGLSQLLATESPNEIRVNAIKRRIETMEKEVIELRRKMTEGSTDTKSLARIQGELMVAQADVATRQTLLATSLQAVETSRLEANRQTRYLTTSVRPIPPDVATYPRVFENTLVTMLICLGIYLMISMTVAILREQVST